MTIVNMFGTLSQDLKELFYRHDTQPEIYAAKRRFVVTAVGSMGVGAFMLWNQIEFRNACRTVGEAFLLDLCTALTWVVGHDLTQVAYKARSFAIIQHAPQDLEEQQIQTIEELIKAIQLGRRCFAEAMGGSYVQSLNTLRQILSQDEQGGTWQGTISYALWERYCLNYCVSMGIWAAAACGPTSNPWVVVQGIWLCSAPFSSIYGTLQSAVKCRTTYDLIISLAMGGCTTLFFHDLCIIKSHDLGVDVAQAVLTEEAKKLPFSSFFRPAARLFTPIAQQALGSWRYYGTILPLPYDKIL